MAMIQCEECGQWISDRASACPHCGCPTYEDYYEEAYQSERGAIQARQDAQREIQERNARIMRRWRKDYIAMSVVMFFTLYMAGIEFSKTFYGVLGLIICYIFLIALSGLSFWKILILHTAFPKLLGYEIIAICSCVGYTLGFLKGL